jgi:hypothetical protein
MDALRKLLKNPLYVGIGAFIIGLFIGLVVLGWGLWPVQWTDAAPEHLRIEYQEIYLRMAIDSYTLNPNLALAQQHITEIGENAPDVMATIAGDPQTQNPESIQAFVNLAGMPTSAATPLPGTPMATAVTTEETIAVTEVPTVPVGAVELTPTSEATQETSVARQVLPWMCLITLLLAGALVVIFLLRNRGFNFKLPKTPKQTPVEAESMVPSVTGEEPPLAQFMTTYQIGNDLFDDSFSIDSPAGEFLGECGVGISETIGVGDPKKVTAFEVWLFDKNDIQTVTKVLMSSHAIMDEPTKNRLAAKGEPILAQPGTEVVLETATLRLTTRVVDMSYGSGALPEDSFFERLTLELVARPKV